MYNSREIDPANRDETSSSNQWTEVLCSLALVIIAWGIILFAFSTHQTALIDHDYLLRVSHLPWLLALGLFLASWQIMTIAMMLPMDGHPDRSDAAGERSSRRPTLATSDRCRVFSPSNTLACFLHVAEEINARL